MNVYCTKHLQRLDNGQFTWVILEPQPPFNTNVMPYNAGNNNCWEFGPLRCGSMMTTEAREA